MNECIELHDSVLQSLIWIDYALVLTLNPAYINRSTGRPAEDPGTGWLGRATIRIDGATRLAGMEFPTAIWQGKTVIGGVILEDCIPSCGRYIAEVRLQIDLVNGESLDLHGHSMTIQREAECTYLEEFRP
jgi:hypothetical protein